jgi:hypothetical protein
MHGIFYDFPIDNALNFTNNQTTRVSLVRRELTQPFDVWYALLFLRIQWEARISSEGG